MLFKNKNVYLENQVEALTNTLENFYLKFQATIEDQISSMIGIDKWFNTDNQHKDQEIVKTGGANFRKTWALMDSKNILYIDDYPLLFEVIKAEDRGDGTFAMPDFHDGTLRHIRYGDTRDLGTFEEDAIKSHLHSQPAHSHTLPDITGEFRVGLTSGNNLVDFVSSGAFYNGSDLGGGNADGGDHASATRRASYKFSSHHNGAKMTGSFGNENTTNTGVEETRMKNTSGQWYILAKVTYN